MEQKIMHGKNLLKLTEKIWYNEQYSSLTVTNCDYDIYLINGTSQKNSAIEFRWLDAWNSTTIHYKLSSGNYKICAWLDNEEINSYITITDGATSKEYQKYFSLTDKQGISSFKLAIPSYTGKEFNNSILKIAIFEDKQNENEEFEPYKEIVPVRMLKGKEENLHFLDVQDGQLIFTTDTKNIYLDNGSTRGIYSSDGNSSFVAQEEPVTAINGDVWFVEEEKPSVKIVSFGEGTDDEIAAMLEAHYRGDIDIADHWKIGDSRIIHLNSISSPNTNEFTKAWPAQDIVINIVAMNHHKLKARNGVRDYAAITCQTRECLNNLAKYGLTEYSIFVDLTYGTDTTFKKWSQLPMRTWMNEAFLTTCFSSKMQSMIKETVHNRLTTNGASSHTTEEVIDKIFLPSYTEIFSTNYEQYLGGADITSAYEGEQLEYYKTSSHRIKYANNNGQSNGIAVKWWHSSPSSDSSSGYKWGGVNTDGTATHANGYTGYGLVPAFCL